jgi:hypothetical protein
VLVEVKRRPTNVITYTVMTQIELQCGPHRVVSLMSIEAAP